MVTPAPGTAVAGPPTQELTMTSTTAPSAPTVSTPDDVVPTAVMTLPVVDRPAPTESVSSTASGTSSMTLTDSVAGELSPSSSVSTTLKLSKMLSVPPTLCASELSV